MTNSIDENLKNRLCNNLGTSVIRQIELPDRSVLYLAYENMMDIMRPLWNLLDLQLGDNNDA